MKFIQLLSTIASLAIFATAPGVSAAGLRAGGDKTEEASGRRNLQAVMYGLPGQVPGMPGPQGGLVGPLVGPINTPGGMGMGGPGVDFNDENEASYYNGLYNPGRAHAYAHAHNNYNYYGEGYGGGPGYGRASSRGHGGDVDCSKFTTRQACHAHDHDHCGWDDNHWPNHCHSY